MHGSSRSALSATRSVLNRSFNGYGDALATARSLYAAVDVIDSNVSLRRALADPSREAESKRALVRRLFGGKVGNDSLAVIEAAAGERWSQDRDLTDSLERLAVEAATASAEKADRADAFENELFRFERTVAANQDLGAAVSAPNRSASDKEALVARLLDGKVTPETMLVASRAAGVPRGRRFERVIEEDLSAIATRRGQSTAIVTTATVLDDEQARRLTAALSHMYGKPVQINTVIDPQVVGGIRVQIGDDVIDGTIARRIEEARTHLAG